MPDHIGVNELNSKIAILTGNPDRVQSISKIYPNAKLLTKKRGYFIYELTKGNVIINLISTGIGSPSTAIIVEELIELGIKIILRIGTCGAIQSNIQPYSIVVSTGCIRNEGTSKQYIDEIFPSVPDILLTYDLIIFLKSIFHEKLFYGITHCKDSYYSEKIEKSIDLKKTKNEWETWKKANALVTEMESSPLFILGTIRKIQVSAIFISIDEKNNEEILNNLFYQLLENVFELFKQKQLYNQPNKPIPVQNMSSSFLGK
jgi:uridine phosphorylase